MRGSEDVKNWMNMFRWIVKLIRDDYGIPEEQLTRHATIEKDLGLDAEQVEQVMEIVSEAFQIRFPDDALDELVRLEELCLLASWLAGFYKQPPFLADDFVARAVDLNPRAVQG
ncbi:acyl carrier protein [Azorhizobium doebereinerae]|uniref:acyl carrier protein n=1 Tax=Azorhizobium doebereinerae TaxID=281091 RepID=UPI00041C181E|nr:phosphopantetheine-binding protein [Azorhizobium doebereinerae]